MDLFKQLETAIQSTAAAVVEGNLVTAEFPAAASSAAALGVAAGRTALSGAASAAVTGSAAEAWQRCGWEGRKAALRRVVERLQQQQQQDNAGGGGGAAGGGGDDVGVLADVVAALLELPDPAHALASAAAATKRVADLEAELGEARRDLKAARADDAEVRQLAADHAAERAAGARLRADLEAARAELVALRAAADAGAEQRAALEAKTAEAERLQAALAKLRGEHEASQAALFDALARNEAAASTGAVEEQLAAALDELDRARAHAAAVASQRDALQGQVAELTARVEQHEERQRREQQQQEQDQEQDAEGGDADPTLHDGLLSTRSSGGSAILSPAAREAERLQARANLDSALSRLRDAEHQARLLATRAETAESQAARLQAELDRRPTREAHAEAVSTAETLSALLGRQLEAEGFEGAAAATLVSSVVSDPGRLPFALQERVTKLTAALADASRGADELRAERDAARQQAAAVQAQLAEARAATAQLEADLAVAASTTALGGGGVSGAAATGAGASADAVEHVSLKNIAMPSSVDGASAGAAGGGTGGDCGSGNVGADGAVLLPVVLRQRDRLSARVAELEEERGRLEARASELTGANERLTADNVRLVEQIRFVKARQVAGGGGEGGGLGVGAGGGGAAGGATIIRVDGAGAPLPDHKAARYSCGPVSFELAAGRRRKQQQQGQGLSSVGAVGAAEARYLPAYERGLDPWSSFRAQEAEGRVRNMRLHERAMFAAGSVIVGSPLARLGLLLYVALLHAYVVFVVYARAAPHCSLSRSNGGSSAGVGGGGGG